MKIVWSPLAVDRAIEAAEFIAEDKPEAARRWLDGLFNSVERLLRFPQSGRVVPEIGIEMYREVLYKSHRVIYRVERKQISILTVRGAKQALNGDELSLD
ncbi:MAG TPA: type II toxin-antitoxin system RelE/ParE family toxin [Rhodothermia bacterium]|nr:type II toxin-antitoxin system RelE/ParE family toxin [Rhodothermia bacterium]